MGLPMSFVVNKFLNDFIVQRQVTFIAYPMSAKLEKRLIRVEKDTKYNKNVSQIFPSISKAIDYLHSKSK